MCGIWAPKDKLTKHREDKIRKCGIILNIWDVNRHRIEKKVLQFRRIFCPQI